MCKTHVITFILFKEINESGGVLKLMSDNAYILYIYIYTRARAHTHTHARARARARTHTHTHTHTIVCIDLHILNHLHYIQI